MEAYLEQVSDQVLSSEAGLLRLYAVKARADAAASRRRHLPLHRRGLTGVRYAMRPTSVKELSASRRKRDELHAMLHEVVATPSRILVFFELEPLLRRDGGMITDLLSLLEKRNRLREEEARAIFVRLAAHELGVALRNIKPEGVQVSQRVKGEPRLHLVDLHCAAIVDDTDEQHGGLSGLHGTPEGRPVDAVLRDVNAADFTFDDPDGAAALCHGTLFGGEPLTRLLFRLEVLQHQFCGAALQEAVPCTRDDSLKDSDYDKALAALDSDGD
ncbi:hypothetical protein EMIHUDRAFT_204480 [Emiliania huxleyi CCMP1516]|uniref:Protein kinase domain-containing protein n=2 Tax=Emiliania huxleyi TaxID=2903 RepID=A0A0D3JYH3_EMIH1|nr:hypothetical protein EMIHUDRAFT_204480 [Emiliania huxleyi CCMP1516]EOD28558.1 hypothetical protein EMIHUDRAFT_204480 [Emiliania huxleyi CCMP1516]|eukprot:XP_005780987.1 hypothetical protein EMIHUDRAFT_204480 [Emiliania huxleyi CCMP1516]